ncbi:MAG: ABC transporter permease [Bacteroidota bacterium]
MLKNFITIAWRNLLKHKTFSVINVFGLSAGIAFSLLIGAFIWSEFQVNKDLKNNDRIYMVQSKWKDPNMGYDFSTLAPLAKALKTNYPQLVEEIYHHDGITSIVSKGEKHFSEGLQVGDASLLSMFGFPLLYGDAVTALNKPDAIAITEAKAIKYFGKTDVIGQSLSLQSFSGSKQDFIITAVLKNPPVNTITNWGNGINKGSNEFFLSDKSLRFFGRDAGFEAWQNAFIISYVQLKKGISPAALEIPVKKLLATNTTPDVQKNLGIVFTPVKDYYLQSNNGVAFRMIYSLGFVALFILMMAIINFINISIGNSVSRLREIGVRKVMGGSKKQLIIQFLTESIVMVTFSVLISIIIYLVARTYFGEMLGKELPELSSFPVYFLLMPAAIILLVGSMAGIYPAFVLSRQKSIESLKGKLETVKEKIAFRYTLIATQFVTGIIVFIAALVINDQVNYFFSKNLGYKKDFLITARVPRDWSVKGVQHITAVRDQFIQTPEIETATFSFEIPDGASAGNNINLYKASQDSTQGIISESLFTDEKYLETYKIPLTAGKFFNAAGGVTGNSDVVLNESAARGLGWKEPETAIGEKIKFQGSQQVFTVTGVAKDFHFGSLHQQIRPMYFIHVNNALLYRYLTFKLKPGNSMAAIATIQKKWSQLLPDAPFDYHFMDDTLGRLYTTEIQMKKASETATLIALLIVLLGVLGIVTQSITKRTKETGIRKILGASVAQIMLLFSKEFGILIIIANLVAWPLAYLLVSKWLNNYAYRVEVSPLPFVLVSGCIAILVAAIIVLKTLKTATANPVKNIRTE